MAEEFPDKTILLLGCGDSYVQLAAHCKDRLPENVVAPYIDGDLLDTLINKRRLAEARVGGVSSLGHDRLNIPACVFEPLDLGNHPVKRAKGAAHGETQTIPGHGFSLPYKRL